MDKTEQRAHDLAILFVKHQMDRSCQDTDKAYDEATVLEMYKAAFDNFYSYLLNP